MGAKQTKIEGCYLPDTPTMNRINTDCKKKLSVKTNLNETELNLMDPRSPAGCRTPINIFSASASSSVPQETQVQVFEQEQPLAFTENPLTCLRKRIFRGFTYNLNDPRSPYVNRTPLMLKDEQNDKTLNLDDTFSDLFVDTKAPTLENNTAETKFNLAITNNDTEEAINEIKEEELEAEIVEKTEIMEIVTQSSSFVYVEEETMQCAAVLAQTQQTEDTSTAQQAFDPRSPTFGVERTPIIFTDDDDNDEKEDAMLEDVLATLCLNNSSTSSASTIAMLGTPPTSRYEKFPRKIANKHLERVRGQRKRLSPTKAATNSSKPSQVIYVDAENDESFKSEQVDATPHQKKMKASPARTVAVTSKRTPLSCVKNRPNMRSRSVEISEKSLKTRLALSSYDDSFNEMHLQRDVLVTNAKHKHGSRDKLEF